MISADHCDIFLVLSRGKAWFGLGRSPQWWTRVCLGCFCCLMEQKGLSRGSPAGGSQALVTEENFQLWGILHSKDSHSESLHSLNKIFASSRLGLFTLPVSNGALFAGRSHSTEIHRAEWCAVSFFFPPLPFTSGMWEFRLLRWTFPS